MTKEEMWKEFENQLVRETRTPMTMSYDASEKMTKFAIKETVAKWKEKLEQQPSDDCVSRKAVFEAIDDCNSDGLKGIFCSYEDGERFKEYIKKLSPVTPTQCIATVQFSKEELRDICNERIEIACQHGTCKDCKHLCDWHKGRSKGLYCGLHTEEDFCFEVEENFYCAYFEKRGAENE